MKSTRVLSSKLKRVVSAVTAAALVSNAVLFPEFSGFINRISNIQLFSSVSAAGNEMTISSIKALVDFSYNYQGNETYAAAHQFDTIKLALTGDTGDLFQYQNDNDDTILKFQSIGTAKYPFGGTIHINAVGSEEINIDTAFFDYVYDYAVISGDNDKHIKILTTSDHTDAALANHVVHDDRAGVVYVDDDGAESVEDQSTLKNYSNWTIETVDYSTGAHNRGSLIGELGQVVEGTNKSVKVTINYISNATGAVIDAGNAGTICGKINGDSVLTVESISGNATSSVTSNSGHAGGIVGEMLPGSILNINDSNSSYIDPAGTITANTNNCYAGGIVGKNDSATINSAGFTTINNTIKGNAGAGGVFGYYKPIMTNSEYSLDLADYTIGSASNRCKVSSTNAAGGLIGVLDNPSGKVTISGNGTTYSQGNDDSTVFGGLIGVYRANALTDTLEIKGTSTSQKLTVNTSKSGNLANYGGIIGIIDGAWFVSISDVNVDASNASDEIFGGAVSTVNTGYVYVNNLKVKASDFHGGGVVGHTQNGVVHLSGATDLSEANANTGSSDYGQIVGYRDNAFVFADSAWNLTRYIDSVTSKGVAADNVGSWGEVVRFTSLDIDDVLSTYYNPDPNAEISEHYATLKGASNTLSNVTTFALAALNMQLNDGKESTAALRFADTSGSSYEVLKGINFTMSGDIDLSLTGITGLTRDNIQTDWTSGISPEYNGTSFSGGGNLLTLAIGEGYEGQNVANSNTSGRGRIYRHCYNGLFGILTNNFTVSSLNVNGRISTYAVGNSDFFIGAIAGEAQKALNVTSVKIGTTATDMSIDYGIDNNKDINPAMYIGGLAGKLDAPGTSVIGTGADNIENAGYTGTVNSTFQAVISGRAFSNQLYVGGISGYVGSGPTATSLKIYDATIGGKVENAGAKPYQKIGGLFAEVAEGGSLLELDGVTVTGLTVSGAMGTNTVNKATDKRMGGLLGYCWNVPTTLEHVTISNCTLNNLNTGGDMAGLVNMGCGYWQFKDVAISGLTVSGTAASSLGMLVNRAWTDSDHAMYLELPTGYSYTIQNVTGSGAVSTSTVYDEIAAYSAIGDNAIETNGNAVISINTSGTTKYGTQTDATVNMTSGNCNTYQNQVTATGFNTYNPHTRYYYNLDSYKNNSANSAAENLYIYSVQQYAHSSISSNFVFLPENKEFSGILDMAGYSYYPFDLTEAVSISGSLEFHNAEIEAMEANEATDKGDDVVRTTRDGSSKSQHYLMHAGLFRNVSSTVTIDDDFSLGGTVAKIDDYCGALICGTISGDANGDATFDSTAGAISLDGIKICNYSGTGAESEYAPLLINKSGGYVVLNLKNLSASKTAYNGEKDSDPDPESGAVTKIPTTDFVATSLVGIIGNSSAQQVRLEFNNVKFDGRKKTNTTETVLTNTYGTINSIFSKATLLESLSYAAGSGSSGIYNYEYSEDWSNGSDGKPKHDVTYGSEISDEASKNKKLEYWYNEQSHTDGTGYYTDPLDKNHIGSSDASAPYDFSGFLPYVFVSCANITNATVQRQLDVNHTASEFDGCGTYNHPYTITTGSDLETIAFIIANKKNNLKVGYTISLPDDISTPTTWCDNQNSCKDYELDEAKTAFVCTTDSNNFKDFDVVRKYLAGAYYYLDNENGTITLTSNYEGLGSANEDDYVFRGVIAGNGQIIVNQSGAPLISTSNGSVVRKLTVQVGSATEPVTIELADHDSTFSLTGSCGTYGTVFGRVLGGDNIIDEVKVNVSNAVVTAGNITQLTPVGGYVGVVVEGGVIFRNMNDTLVPVANKAGFGSTGVFAENNMSYLYCNPIIGRVINGYAVNETDSDTKDTYAPYESGSRIFGDNTPVSGNATTIKNGNKNYSITDLDPDYADLSISGTTIDVPNSQAFFIMSLIINCGMGTNGNHVIGYYGTNQITRHANYAYIGTSIKQSDYATEAAFKATDAYKDYAKTVDDTNASPYVLSEYASGAANIGSGSGFTLNVNDNIILPDGYKGIGNIYGISFTNGNTKGYKYSGDLNLALTTFDGKGHTISQNTTYYSYKSDSDNYLPYQYIDNSNTTVHGLGLFNYANNATYQDCTLTGNVVARQYNNGSVLDYTASTDFTSLAVGSLVGTLNMSNVATISDIYLKNVYVESTRDAAGMIGYLINDGKKITITNAANTANSTTAQSSGIIVNAGTNAAGMIARQGLANANQSNGRGDISIDLNGHYFNYTSILSRYNGKTQKDTWYADWALGVGGLVGIARANNSDSSANTISISNVKIGKDNGDTLRTVSCEYKNNGTTTYGNIYVGGLVGVFNRCPVNITNCDVYNVNVSSGKYSGGLVGWGGTASEITIDNCTLKNTLTAKVYSSSDNAGGVVGYCKDDMGKFTVKNSTIDGYTIEGTYAGGALGNWQASSNAFSLVNSVISKCVIKYSTSGGGIAGQLKKNLYGYNVRVSDITFTPSGTAQQGYICGKRDGGVIKISGFHRTGTISEAKLIGNNTDNKMTNMYGAEGYVIFADFEGRSALTTPSNTIASTINLKSAIRVDSFGASPYVTINPSITIENNIGLVTGDGMITSAVNSILTNTSSKKYAVAGTDIANFLNDDGTVKTDLVSSFKTELGDAVKDAKKDFPVLVINNTETADLVLNQYLRALTNTDDAVDFTYRNGNNQESKIGIKKTDGTFNYSTNNGIVTIRKCTYNNGIITISTSNNDASLYLDSNDSNKVKIRTKTVNGKTQEQYDTATPGQFTLIDIAFKDPTSTTYNVSYHLYIPVVVKKLLEYNFHISLSSGTSYDKTLYEGHFGNNLVENLGAPITAEIKYTYLRTETEWTAEGETGSNFNYDKKLEFKCTADTFESGANGTKMVLIDPNNGGKTYYLDNLSISGAFSKKSGTTNIYTLDLQKFKAADGTTPFSPVNLNALTETETVTFSNGTSGVYRTERYYLSIFTVPQAEKAIHYEITNANLDHDGFPTRRLKCECNDQLPIAPHYVSHLIMGDFYDNILTVTALTEQQKMDISNSSIDAHLSATVKIKQSAENVVNDYLDNDNVTIYQTLLATLQDYKTDLDATPPTTNAEELGVRYLDEASVIEYTVKHYSSNGTLITDTVTAAPIPGANYVEFPNNKDISNYLKIGEVQIDATVTFKYYTESNRTAEFPFNTEGGGDNSGSTVVGYSNISSKMETAAYSNVTQSNEDIDKKYYNATSVSTSLKFNASYPSDRSQDNQLGVNALDVTGTTAEIRTVGIYDVSKLSDIQAAEYILCEIELEQKTKNGESYASMPDISTYINNFNVCGKATGTDATVVYRDDTSGSKYTFILKRSLVDSSVATNVYTIPINFTVYTGDNTSFEQKNGGGLQYGNYKVKLSTTLLNSYTETTTNGITTLSLDTIGKSNANDYVIYTNARVYADLIK